MTYPLFHRQAYTEISLNNFKNYAFDSQDSKIGKRLTMDPMDPLIKMMILIHLTKATERTSINYFFSLERSPKIKDVKYI